MDKNETMNTEGNQNHEPKVNFDTAKVNEDDMSLSYVDEKNCGTERNHDSKSIVPHQMPTWEETGAKVMTPKSSTHGNATRFDAAPELDLKDVLNALH